MVRVAILGGGNIANHLIKAFLENKEVVLQQIYAREVEQVKSFENSCAITNSIAALKEADVYIIAVSDTAIGEVSAAIPSTSLVVHTSGSVAMDSLKNSGRKGVFYPLQSFTKDKKVNFQNIPFCIEAETKEDLFLLEKLAHSLSDKIYPINSQERRYLHVAAVFVNNFTNHLYRIGEDICINYKVPFEILMPLIKETAEKIEAITPKEAQTGPAKRKDSTTMQNHLNLLTEEQQKIYKILSDSIIHGEKL